MPSNRTNTWTDEAIAKLEERWADGQSARQISDELGMSRNAVLGKVHRLGLKGGSGQSFGEGRPKGAKDRKPRRRPFKLDTARFQRDMADPAFDVRADLPPALPPVTAVFFHELAPHHCRFPYGHTPDMLFCGAIATIGSYCAGHHAVTHEPRRSSAKIAWNNETPHKHRANHGRRAA